jgi:hypothetical protein
MATEAPSPAAASVAADLTAAPAVKALTCPGCGGTVTIRAAGYTVTVACQYCGSILDVSTPEVQLVVKYEEAAGQLEIPLGTRGVLRGVEWEAIGYMRRSEHNAYPWVEYLLFNPYHGYRWLVTDGRGWSFGEMLTVTPSAIGTSLWLGTQSFDPFFTEGSAQVDYVLGEFYWQVRAGETVRTGDYVRPGWMLSREQNESEIAWTLLELIDPKEMGKAFGVAPPPHDWPPLPHQVSPYAQDLKRLGKFFLAAAALILVLGFMLGAGPTLFRSTLALQIDGQSRSATLGPVTLTRPRQIVTIRASAPGLENSWVDIDYALVDRKTQASYEAYGLAERYSGRDSDGAWTEGNRKSEIKVASVPAGTYDLVVDYSATRWSGGQAPPSDWSAAGTAVADPPQALEITLSRGGVFFSNVLIALVLLLLPLLFMLRKHVKFEQARQAESDVGPTGLAQLFTPSEDDE